MERDNALQFQRVQQVPDTPPTLTVNGSMVPTFAVDWRTGDPINVPPKDNLDGVPRLSGENVRDLVLEGSPMPSELSLRVYVGDLENVDPIAAPEETYDFVNGDTCNVRFAEDSLVVDVSGLVPESAGAVVLSLTASYFVVVDEQPGANAAHWVFELSQ